MAMVQPKSQKLRLFTTHLLLLIFIAAIMFPLLMVIAISLREGNFATGSLIPDTISWEHWRLALGFSVEHADGRVTPPPFPVLLWLWNSIKVAGITAIGIVALSTTCAYAFARMRFPGKATLLKGMLIFQMFPAVLSLVALYALFDRTGQYIRSSASTPTAASSLPTWAVSRCTSGRLKATSKPSMARWKKRRRWMARPHGRLSVWCCCRCRCRFWQSCLFCRSSRPSPKCRSPRCCCAM